MNRLSVLMPSWKGPELLKFSIPAFIRACKEDTKLYVVLNDADKESIELCQAYDVEFIALKENWGTLGVDFFLPTLNCEAVGQINSDMIPSEGWDTNLLKILKENGPCSVSTQLVEPYGTHNPLVYVDNLGEFSLSLEFKFQENYRNGQYNRDTVVGYNHPIIVTLEDYKKVGGYSNNFDARFRPLCYGLDDHYAWRLRQLHPNFQFIASGKDFVYHCISATNNKFDKNYRDSNNGMNHFQHDSGMTLWGFRNSVNAFSKVEVK